MLDMLCSREKDTIEMNEDELFKKMEMHYKEKGIW